MQVSSFEERLVEERPVSDPIAQMKSAKGGTRNVYGETYLTASDGTDYCGHNGLDDFDVSMANLLFSGPGAYNSPSLPCMRR